MQLVLKMASWLTITAKDFIKTASLSDFENNNPLSFKLSVNCKSAKMHSYSWMTPRSLVKSRTLWAGISVPQASIPDSANYFRTSLPGLTSFFIIITKIVVFWIYCLLEHLFWCSNGKRLCTISHILMKLFHCPGCFDHPLQSVLMES